MVMNNDYAEQVPSETDFDDEPWLEEGDYSNQRFAPSPDELALMHEENLGIHIPMAEDAYEVINANLGYLHDVAEEMGDTYGMQAIAAVHESSTQLAESIHQLSATGAGLTEVARTFREQRNNLAEALSSLKAGLDDAYYSEHPDVVAAVEQIEEVLIEEDFLGDHYYNELYGTAVQNLRNWGCEENVTRFVMMILGEGLGSPHQAFKRGLAELLENL